ncbi:reverse transcriptase domain-containing protein [Tanacetum coccineum]
MVDSQSPEEGVKKITPENGETRPQKGFVVPFTFDNDHPTLAFASQTGNTSSTSNIEPNESIDQRFQVSRIYVDGGSSSEVMYGHCFRNLRMKTKAKLKEFRSPLVWFSGETDKTRESDESIQPSPTASEKDTHGGEKGKEKDELLEKSLKTKPLEKVLIKILRKHGDAFAWTPADMTRIPRFFAEHELKTYPHIEPIMQRKRSIAPNIRKVVKDEVAEWFKAKIVRKVWYPSWVANLVLVKKPDNSWRMCIDFKDLNKAYLKDLYSLPEIEWKIESLIGFKYKCFLDAYKGYHQIKMAKKDEEKTAFHTDKGVFCYKKRPFGLKSARATYQRLVNTIFEGQMGRNLEAYVDDMVVKSKTELEMIKDVEETLLTLKKVNMKLNSKKCSYGMEEGKFLGYIVTYEGIKANPEKTKAVMDMPSPSNLKQMQRLNGKLAALNRFLSKATERALPCLDTLKKYANKKDFHWMIEAEEAFQAMKKLIAELPTFTAPKKEEELIVYLSAANEAVSAVLLVERNERQTSIHYVSRTLQGAKINYPPMEKLALALVYAARRLRREIGHMGSRTRILWHQVYAQKRDKNTKQEAAEPPTPINLKDETDIWKLYFDGASNDHRSGAGLILIDLEGIEYSYALQLNFANSNNDAEYEALLAGLRIATKMKVKKMHEFVDSKLVANQVEGSYEVKGKKTNKYKEKALEMIQNFSDFQINHISREENRKDDALSKLASVQCEGLTKGVLGEELNERSMDMAEVNAIIQEAATNDRYGVPATIITDNETQLINDPFRSWAEGLGIKLVSTSGIKTRLHQEGGAWVEELPNVLRAHRKTPKTTNGETPFSQAYGTEAVIPAKIGIPTRRTIQGSDKENEEALGLNLNLLEERRDIVAIREARRKLQVEKYYNHRVHHKQFKVGEFVLQKNKLLKMENIGNQTKVGRTIRSR